MNHTAAPPLPTAADLRAERARKQLPIFVLASKVGVHPFRLGQLLNGRRTLTPAMARKIAAALAHVEGEAAAR